MIKGSLRKVVTKTARKKIGGGRGRGSFSLFLECGHTVVRKSSAKPCDRVQCPICAESIINAGGRK